MRYLGLRTLTQFLARAASPGPDAAIFKLYWSEYHREVTELAVDILGADAMAPSGRWPASSFQTDDAGAPNDSAQLGRHVPQRPGRHDLRRDRARSSATSSARWCSGLPKEPGAPTPARGATQQAARHLSVGWALRALRRRAAATRRCGRPALRQVLAASPGRAGGGGRRSSRCPRRTTSASGWRRPTAMPATSEPEPDDVVTYLRWCRDFPTLSAPQPRMRRPTAADGGSVPAMSGALVLNATYEPLCVVPSRRAAVLVLARARPTCSTTRGEALHSEHLVVPVPSVIRLRSFVKVPFQPAGPAQPARRVRPRRPPLPVLRRPRRRASTTSCPRSKGGEHAWENVVAACRPCNVRKRDRLLHETSMELRRRPTAPARARPGSSSPSDRCPSTGSPTCALPPCRPERR